ncbi:DsbA family oxidoreductase [Pinirhizobacter sp.]|jgi:predicted DsbA family dithiol-disulfide isomerase|uniref:DsbA family oxidoreductase n=1 Tax=Pinirhizobacter sp. TaxID=2950432 RepID=UPI002F3EEA2F
MKIDFISDVACPWCAVGLNALQEALGRVGDEVKVDLHFQPFELNPGMPAEGQDAVEHLVEKYGSTPEQIRHNGQAITDRGAELGFRFDMEKRSHVYNTFDAHRLLHWAGELGQAQQLALKKALLAAYFTDGRNVSDHAELLRIVDETKLDVETARLILAGDQYAAEVRAQEAFFMERGIRAVPAVVINDRHLISGGQPVEVFERAIRQIAAGG